MYNYIGGNVDSSYIGLYILKFTFKDIDKLRFDGNQLFNAIINIYEYIVFHKSN